MMNKLIAFHGADHKCGVTMLTQSIAELIAWERKDLNVLQLSLNGRKSTEYVRENVDPIDTFKIQLDSGIAVTKRILAKNKRRENLYMIGGIEKELESRFYSPETATGLIENLAEGFDIILADTGSEADNGLAIGGLSMAGRRCLVLTQNEVAIKRYENTKGIYEKLEINFESYVVNKHQEKDPYSTDFLSERLGIGTENLFKVEMTGYGRMAEMEYRTLLEYSDDKYGRDVLALANEVLRICGAGEIKYKRKLKWKSFI